MVLNSRVRTLLIGLGLFAVLAATPAAAASTSNGQTRPIQPEVSTRSAGVAYSGEVYHHSIMFHNTGNYESGRCWTHFIPAAPAGLPMAQSYRNCNGYALRVRMGYYIGGGFVEDVPCHWVNNGQTVFVLRARTYAGNYTTLAC